MQPISCSFGVIQVSKNQSVVKKAAYNCREKIHSDKLGELINYSFKQDLLADNILAPDNAEPWVFDRQQHYNKVEKQDKRINSQQGRTIRIGLPYELSLEENQKLLEHYLKTYFVDLGMVADYAIHAPEPDGDERNIHTHVILSMRRLDGDGFNRKKARDWNTIDVETWREAWANEVNQAYEAKGIKKRVTHLSLERQGSKKLPQRHLGKKSTNLRRHRGIETSRVEYNNLIKEYNQLIDDITAYEEAEADDNNSTGFDTVVERTSLLLEGIERVKTEELNYWIEIRELEGVEVELETSKIETQYDTLQQAALDLSGEVIELDRKRRRKPDRKTQPDIDNKTDLGQSKRYETPTTSGSSVDAVQNTAQLENNSNPATKDAGEENQRAERRDSSPAIHISDTQSDRPIRERAAIDIACRVAAKKPNPKTVKSPTNVYRLSLAKIVKKSDPETIANAYKDNDISALECDLRIYRFMKSKGFNHNQIRKAMRQASPATYRKSKIEADRYARRFNEWARNHQKNQQKNRPQKRKIKRRR